MLSIIIPVKNASQHIETVMENLAQQTFRDLEMVFLDNLSTDNTPNIIDQYRSSDNRIRVFSEKDEGIYDAMNKGIAHARGDWVYFMGSDDLFFDENVLQNIAAELNDENDIVYGDVLWMPDAKKEEGYWGPHELLKRNINHQRIFYRKTLFERYGNYDLTYKVAADHELNIRFFCNDAMRKKYIPMTVAVYHSGGFSAGKMDEAFWNNWENIILKNFSPHLSKKEIYKSMGWYCWYKMQLKKYGEALKLFWKIFLHTGSITFMKHSASQFFKSLGGSAA